MNPAQSLMSDLSSLRGSVESLPSEVCIRVEVGKDKTMEVAVTSDFTVSDVLNIVCTRHAMMPSKHKCKVTFSDKRVEFPGMGRRIMSFEGLEFISVLSKENQFNVASSICKSSQNVEMRITNDKFPKTLAVPAVSTVDEGRPSHTSTESTASIRSDSTTKEDPDFLSNAVDFAKKASTNTNPFLSASLAPKTGGSSNALGLPTGNALGISSSNALGALGLANSNTFGVSSKSALGLSTSNAMGLSSTNALGLSNITAAPASFVNTSLGSSSATNSHGLPIKAVTNEQKHSPPETQAPAPTMLQKVESAQSVACESLPARISPGPSSQVEDGANAVKNLSLEHIRTSSAHETVSRTSTSASGGDSTKPVEILRGRKDTNRSKRSESLTNVKIWDIPMKNAQNMPPEEGKALLIVTLPDYKSVAIKTMLDVTMDDILSFICNKNKLDFDGHSFHLNYTSDTQVEMDRPFSFYLEHKVSELFIVPGEKRYRTRVITENGQDVMILQSTYGTLQVMAGTLDKLIDRLVDPEVPIDEPFMDTFLLTFRAFLTPQEFLEKLMGRYFCILPADPSREDVEYFNLVKQPTQIRALDTLTWWIEYHWHDYTLSSELKNTLDEFIDNVAQEENPKLKACSTRLLKLINQQTVKYEEMQNYYRIVARRGKTMESMFMEINPEELGQQLCLHNFRLFRNIHAMEVLNQIWIGKKEETPYLTFFIERFDKESYWVATEIVSQKDFKKRVQVLKNCVHATQASVKYNNFFSLFSFMAGLYLSPVTRLKKTWEALPEPTKKVFADLEKLIDPSRNMKNYRDTLTKAVPPIVPFLPIYLKDLTFMNDGNPKFVDGLVNFDKLRMMGNRVKDIVSLAAVDFTFSAQPAIQNFIAMPPVETSLAKLKELSLICEKAAS